MDIIGYLAALLIGMVLGLIGAGGSLLLVPVLIYLFSVQVVEATSYTLIIVGFTSSVGASQRLTKGLVDVKTGLYLGIPSIITMFLMRKWLLPITPEVLFQTNDFTLLKRHLILVVFSVLIFTASYIMITKKTLKVVHKGGLPIWHYIIQGATIGLLTGFVGIGGGFLIIPVLIFIAGLSFEKAVGTSLFIIALKSLTGFCADLTIYSFNWILLTSIVAFTVLGILSGNYLSLYFQSTLLKRYFGWFTLLVGVGVLLKETYMVLQIN